MSSHHIHIVHAEKVVTWAGLTIRFFAKKDAAPEISVIGLPNMFHSLGTCWKIILWALNFMLDFIQKAILLSATVKRYSIFSNWKYKPLKEEKREEKVKSDYTIDKAYILL